MPEIFEQWFAQAPTVVVLLIIFFTMRTDVKELLIAILRLLEICMGDSQNDGTNGKDRLN